MNSKSFLFAAVFVIISFFALCFVWETRSALPENEGRDISVGACPTGFRAINLPDACEATSAVNCTTKILLTQTYTFPCGCQYVISVWRNGCTCTKGRTKCDSKTGKVLIIDESGNDLFDYKPGECGDYIVNLYSEESTEPIYYEHKQKFCPNNYPNDTYTIPQKNCILDEEHSPIDMSCGGMMQSKKGC